MRRLDQMKYRSQVEDIAALIVEEYFFHCNEQEGKRDDHRDVCKVILSGRGSPVFFVL